VGSTNLPTALATFYTLWIIARQWVEISKKIPIIKVKPTAKIIKTKLIHLFTLDFFNFNNISSNLLSRVILEYYEKFFLSFQRPPHYYIDTPKK